MTTAIIVILVVIAAVLAYAYTRPDTFRYERSETMNAPADAIFQLINDYRQWPAWSPYEKLDPAMTRTMSEPSAGRGAVYTWSGNNKAGSGRMEILESTPSKIVIKLDFERPFEAHNTAEFTILPRGAAHEVTWAMYGPSPFIARLMGLAFNMDKMVGGQFAEGLANLKARVERPSLGA
jgi:hypothetical protein